MKIAIVGTGYVGLVTGTCFAEMGTEVFCVDVDKNKIDNLKKGIVPIYEPGLDELVARNMQAGRLHFTTELKECLDEVEVLFSAVGTPPDEDGSADLKYVLEVARTVGRYMNKYILVVTKSTVPVGTAQKVKRAIKDEQAKRNVNIEFEPRVLEGRGCGKGFYESGPCSCRSGIRACREIDVKVISSVFTE